MIKSWQKVCCPLYGHVLHWIVLYFQAVSVFNFPNSWFLGLIKKKILAQKYVKNIIREIYYTHVRIVVISARQIRWFGGYSHQIFLFPKYFITNRTHTYNSWVLIIKIIPEVTFLLEDRMPECRVCNSLAIETCCTVPGFHPANRNSYSWIMN